MALAKLSGQPFSDMLSWHPRDVETLTSMFEADQERAAEAAREERFAAGTAEVLRRMREGR